MENQKKKCSLTNHSTIDAISYCQKCKIFLCNKCQNLHRELHENHSISKMNKNLKEIFIDICTIEKHNNKFEFYCKTHNVLCCLCCVSKIKIKGYEQYGQHSECDYCKIDDIKDEKRKNLKESINVLEDLTLKIKKSIDEIKILYEKINQNKEELKTKIQKVFTKIRNSLNEKEDK